MPLPSTRVIPTGWSAHHQGVIPGSANARVVITDPTRSTPGGLDPTTGTQLPPTPVYIAGGPEDANPDWRSGVPCRIQHQRDDRSVDHAAQTITVRQYLLQLPAGVPDVEVGHYLLVAAAVNDPHLAGESLTVYDVIHGSERFARDVVAVHNQAPPSQGG